MPLVPILLCFPSLVVHFVPGLLHVTSQQGRSPAAGERSRPHAQRLAALILQAEKELSRGLRRRLRTQEDIAHLSSPTIQRGSGGGLQHSNRGRPDQNNHSGGDPPLNHHSQTHRVSLWVLARILKNKSGRFTIFFKSTVTSFVVTETPYILAALSLWNHSGVSSSCWVFELCM